MPVEFYRTLHFGGLFLLTMSLGAMCLRAMGGGDRNFPQRKWLGMFHGIGSTLALVAGFGMVARMGLQWQGWLFVKLAIWLALSAAPAVIYRRTAWAKWIWLTVAASGFLAAYVARAKPF